MVAFAADVVVEVAAAALERMLEGTATDAQIAAFIVALRIKGETVEEVAALVGAMLDVSSPLLLDDPEATLDIVGTGGSAALAGKAFNVSTMDKSSRSVIVYLNGHPSACGCRTAPG